MELFYTHEVANGYCNLPSEEREHLVKVLRHREGDMIYVVDGKGTMYKCELESVGPIEIRARIIETNENWNALPYNLTLAVCPTKRRERYEWFVEKATEVGVSTIVPLMSHRTERHFIREERLERLVLSASKQSLKAKFPMVQDDTKFKDFIDSLPEGGLKLIAYCFEGESRRISIKEALDGYDGRDITILIGPEGDFTEEEATYALEHGFIPVHLGNSRLRTETAGVTAAEAVYFKFM